MTNETTLLTALMNGAEINPNFQPQNNKQAYLAYLCGLDIALPEPRTEEEVLLCNLCVNGGSDNLAITEGAYLFYEGMRSDIMPELLSRCKGLTGMNNMFYYCVLDNEENVAAIGEMDVSAVKLMSQAFSRVTCASLDLSKWNAVSVTDTSRMFYRGSMEELLLGKFGGDDWVWEEMSNMFDGCENLVSLDLSGFNVLGVSTMAYLFNGCSSLVSVDITSWDTSSVQFMNGMFRDCSSLKKVAFDNIDTGNVTNLSYIFYGCTALEEITGFSATSAPGLTIHFPEGTESSPAALKRLTFRTDLYDWKYAIRSDINVKYCSFDREGMVEMFETLPDVSSLDLSVTIAITGNPCVTDGTLTDEDRAIATNKGWTIVEA